MDLSYGVEKVFNEIIPKLKHGHDGLIFTCCGSSYVVGTDPKMCALSLAMTLVSKLPTLTRSAATFSLKWKPPSENSIDFKLELRFPPQRVESDDSSSSTSSSPDFGAMPVFKLHQWLGNDRYEFFDLMTVEEDEWETCVAVLPPFSSHFFRS